MSFPLYLEGLTPREAITDALHRVVLAFDANDLELLKSSLVSDGSAKLYMGENEIPLEQLFSSLFPHVGPMDTTHIISTIRIDYRNGSDKASLTASAIAQHGAPGHGFDPKAPRMMSGGIYLVDLVKEGEVWKIQRWEMDFKWRQGDSSVMDYWKSE